MQAVENANLVNDITDSAKFIDWFISKATNQVKKAPLEPSDPHEPQISSNSLPSIGIEVSNTVIWVRIIILTEYIIIIL